MIRSGFYFYHPHYTEIITHKCQKLHLIPIRVQKYICYDVVAWEKASKFSHLLFRYILQSTRTKEQISNGIIQYNIKIRPIFLYQSINSLRHLVINQKMIYCRIANFDGSCLRTIRDSHHTEFVPHVPILM